MRRLSCSHAPHAKIAAKYPLTFKKKKHLPLRSRLFTKQCKKQLISFKSSNRAFEREQFVLISMRHLLPVLWMHRDHIHLVFFFFIWFLALRSISLSVQRHFRVVSVHCAVCSYDFPPIHLHLVCQVSLISIHFVLFHRFFVINCVFIFIFRRVNFEYEKLNFVSNSLLIGIFNNLKFFLHLMNPSINNFVDLNPIDEYCAECLNVSDWIKSILVEFSKRRSAENTPSSVPNRPPVFFF